MESTSIWRERPCDEARVAALAAAGVSPVVARVLAARGLDAADLEAFFDPSLARLMAPAALPGLTEAVRVILPFVRDRRRIVVFGDYDTDGVCASAILVSTLRRLGGNAGAFIPLRTEEGYGMTAASLERLLRDEPEVALVVTVDNGIGAVEEISGLRARGITVVVTDHHLPGEVIPLADALVDPRVKAAPGCEDLCGAGVAFFLAFALVQAATEAGFYAGPKFAGPLLVLAGVATVADIVALTGQNRVLVSQALAFFRRCAPVGLRELLDRAARSANDLTARDFGFTLAPRINAAGRMATAREAFELLVSGEEERERARMLAVKLEGYNGARRSFELSMFEEARAQLAGVENPGAVVVWGRDRSAPGVAEGWHKGVSGIVAARLTETYHVPAAVVVGDTGSVRAPDGYNVRNALAASAEELSRYGGHAAAGGFTLRPEAFAEDGLTVRPEALAAFSQAFAAACAAQRAALGDALPTHVFDGWLEPRDFSLDGWLALYRQLQTLEPFGECNPEPVFGLRRVMLNHVEALGAEGKHLTLRFANLAIPRAVWWGHGDQVDTLRTHAAHPCDILFTLILNDYGGTPHAEIRLVDLRWSAPPYTA